MQDIINGVRKCQIEENREVISNWRIDEELVSLVEQNGGPKDVETFLYDLLFVLDDALSAITEFKHILKQEIEWKKLL